MPIGMELGKLPPQAVDLEEGVLGAILLEKSTLKKVVEILRPESFYKEAHYLIYEACVKLDAKGEPIDLLTVTQQLRETGNLENVGGQVYIARLTNKVASSANTEYHARIIAEKYMAREIIRVSNEAIKLAYDETADVFDLHDLTTKQFDKIIQTNVKSQAICLADVVPDWLKELYERSLSEKPATGLPSAIHSINLLTGGYQKTDLIYVAARPGMGKTSFALGEAITMAMQGYPVAFFSLEMSKEQLVNRVAAYITEIDVSDLSRGKLDETRMSHLDSAIDFISNLPIYIDDTALLTAQDFRAKCHKLKQKHGIRAVFGDYVQLMSGSNDKDKRNNNREQVISDISRTLKITAKEIECPVIFLSQLSRQCESRSDKRPMLSDLRESGSLEQDADIVAFLYRPEYYFPDATDENGLSVRGIGEFIVAKHRNGGLSTIKMRFIDHLAKYSDWSIAPNPSTLKPNQNFLEKDEPF